MVMCQRRKQKSGMQFDEKRKTAEEQKMSDRKPVPYLGTPQATIAVLEKYKFVFQKKYGQNFLIDPRVLEKNYCGGGDYSR